MTRHLAALSLFALATGCSNADPAAQTPLDLDSGTLQEAAADGAKEASIDGAKEASSDGSDEDGSQVDAPGDGLPEADANLPTGCIEATGEGASATDRYVDGDDEATVAVSGSGCARSYTLSTTAPLRDSEPENPRTVPETDGWPVVRMRNDLFDALYALALEEARQCSVSAIEDYAFDNGSPMTCPAGGCFETGRLWKYVWTRDTAYAVDLGLGALDPTRSRNSLEFKLSPRRGGTDLQIVQDTGTGGSYPISTDRVVWALGAWEVLKFLDGAERTAFRDLAYEAMRNTIEHDRLVVWDSGDGLYRGEQSFLDWREQSYPSWTAGDVVHIGMSKALSTNSGHLAILEIAGNLAAEIGDATAAARYEGWAGALRTAIREKLYLPEDKQFSTYITTYLDPAPVRRWDALGTSLAVLTGAATEQQAADAIASYPVLPRGVPVLWPQSKDTPIYHNRAVWPFVTAYVARAARKVGNDAVVDNAVHALMRGAALNLSNMENLELVTGRPWLDDGAASGPVVNSQRQLWSVAGYISMVHDVVFGLQAEQDGIRFLPYITRGLREGLFANADSVVLNDFPYRGRRITVVVHLPPAGAAGTGAYAVQAVRLNGAEVGIDFIAASQLSQYNRLDIELQGQEGQGSTSNLVDDVSDYKNLFGPHSPTITAVEVSSGNLRITWNASGEQASEIAFTVYRDGLPVAESLPGATTSWTDLSATASSASHCYVVEAYFVGSKNRSQHAAPWCWWGEGAARVTSFDATTFTATGGTLVDEHGRWHYHGWGEPGHELAVASFTAQATGTHLIQAVASNGAGWLNTGITCGLKVVEVRDGATVVGRGHLMMPHQGTWATWGDSSFAPVELTAGKSYQLVLKHDPSSVNMSFFEHFERYTGGLGGSAGPFSQVNVAELKVLRMVP